MTAAKEHNDELVRKLTERNKIADFGMKVLGMDERRAEAFVKTCGDYFEWDGVTLNFKSANGSVPADDPSSIGFFNREYDFLIPAKKNEDGTPAEIDADLLARARQGNLTARSQLFKQLHTGKDEAATMAKLEKLIAGDGRERDELGRFKKESGESDKSNPWSRAGWNLTAQGRAVRNDPERAKRLAAAAGSFIGATRPAA